MRLQGLTLVEVGIVLVVFAVILAIAIPWVSERREMREEWRVGTLVWKEMLAARNALGTNLQVGGNTVMVKFSTAALRDGRAVYMETENATFWVKDDQIYVVDDIARELLPKHPQAPAEITRDEVLRVAD